MKTVEERSFKQTMNFSRVAMEQFTKWLKALMEYIENNERFKPYKTFANTLRSSGGTVYTVQYPQHMGEASKESYARSLKMELERKGILFFNDASDAGRIVIANEQLDAVKDINREILVARCNYLQEVNTIEMEAAIAKYDGIKNKEIFTIHNLNQYECEVFKNKCNYIDKGFMVGVMENEKGLYDVSVHSSKMLDLSDKSEYRMDVCKAYTKAMISLYGQNALLKMEQILADDKIREEIKALKGTQDVKYVIDAKNPKMFLELNQNGFEYYTTSINDDGKRQDQLIMQCAASDLNYEVELQRYMDAINNKVILDDFEKLGEHLKTTRENFKSERPEKDKREEAVSLGEDLLTAAMDTMIKDYIKTERFDEVSKMSPTEVFQLYQKEASDILKSVTDGAPCRYSEEVIASLRSMTQEKGMDMQKYSLSRDTLTRNNIETHTAREMTREKVKEAREYGYADR